MAETQSSSSSVGDARLQQVLADYLQAQERGEPIDPQRLLAEHPDLADELASFFRNRAAMQHIAAQVQPHELPTTAPGGNGPFPSPGQTIRYFGDYELLSEIARGGMGVVYRARQQSLQRIVALKMVLAGSAAAPADLARFRQEAEAAARLDHPHIVPVYEVGEHDGLHYYTMKLIEGGDLSQQLARLNQRPKDAARLVETVARAVHFAHQHGILHRDLKPANVLIDAQGQPHVTDFGLARLADSQLQMTQTGAAVGTPGYMAPEQIRGEKLLTTAADVYSLGAILFVCLTGQAPFSGANVWETIQKALDAEAPSARKLNATIDRELETICKKALDKDPARRYASAAALADDLSRWLRHEPIEARPPGRVRRSLKWIRRHPARTSLIMLAFSAMLFISYMWWREAAANARTDKELARAMLSISNAEWEDGNFVEARKALVQVPPAQRQWEWRHARQLYYHTPHNRLEFESPIVGTGFSGDGTKLFAATQGGNVSFYDAGTLRRIGQSAVKNTTEEFYQVAVSSDFQLVAFLSYNSYNSKDDKRNPAQLHLLDVATGTERWSSPEMHVGSSVAMYRTIIKFNVNDQTVAVWWVGPESDDGVTTYTLRCFDARTGEQRFERHVETGKLFQVSRTLSALADGRLVVSGGDGQKVFDGDTGERLPELQAIKDTARVATISKSANILRSQASQVFCHALSDDETRFACWGSLDDGDWVEMELDRSLGFVAPDKRAKPALEETVLQPYTDHYLWILNVDTGREIQRIPCWAGSYTKDLKFTPNGRLLMRVVGKSYDTKLKSKIGQDALEFYTVEAAEESRVLLASDRSVTALAISSDGQLLATGDDVPLALEKLSDVNEGDLNTLDMRAGNWQWLYSGYRPFGKGDVTAARREARIRVWDIPTGRLLNEYDPRRWQQLPAKFVRRAHVAGIGMRDHALLVLLLDDESAVVWDATNCKSVYAAGPAFTKEPHKVFDAALFPDGQSLALHYHDVTFTVVDCLTHLPRFQPIRASWGKSTYLRCSTDCRWLTFTTNRRHDQGFTDIRNAQTGQDVVLPETHPLVTDMYADGVSFSHDGKHVCAFGKNGKIRIYRMGGQMTHNLGHERNVITGATFTSDGKRLATSASDGHISLWDLESSRLVRKLRGHQGRITALQFTADDSCLISADELGVIRIWEAK